MTSCGFLRTSGPCKPSADFLGSFFGIGYIPGPTGTYSSAVTAALMLVA